MEDESSSNNSNINNERLQSSQNEASIRTSNEDIHFQIPQFYLTSEELRFTDSPVDRNNNISVFRRRNWNVMISSDEEESNINNPYTESGSPVRIFSSLDHSYLTPHTRLLNRNESRFNIFDCESCSFLGRNQKEKYGKLMIATVKRLMKNRLLNISIINDLIYRRIVTLFFNTLEPNILGKTNFAKTNSSINYVKIKKIISSFPSFKLILKRINSPDFNHEKNRNELFFIKICLDLQHRYYQEFDYPLYKNFVKRNLNVIIKFYERISQENLNYIQERLNNHIFKKYNFTLLRTAEDYLMQTRKQKDECILLSGGLDLDKFMN